MSGPPDLEQVRALLDQQAPHLADLPLRALPGGQDNAVVRIGDHLLARLPRTEASARLLRHEQRWLPGLARALPLPVPAPLLAGRPGAGFPHPWSVVAWLEGGTADAQPYDADLVATALTGFLAALHQPAPAGAPGNPLRGVALAARLPRHRVALAGHPRSRRLVEELRLAASVPGPSGPRRWVHGDLHPRNVVVGARGLAGVLDFGDLHAGDPAVDLAAVWMLLPTRLHGGVRTGLAVDVATWERGRGWALVLGALLREIGLRERDPAFVRVGQRALDAACPPD